MATPNDRQHALTKAENEMAEEAADRINSLIWEDWADRYDDDPNPYHGTYSEE